MADLSVNFAGIKSPNPFWLASGPPTNSGEQVHRAFEAGWGGAVWKTLGNPIVNVSSRLGAIDWGGTRMMGLNNIELISDRPLARAGLRSERTLWPDKGPGVFEQELEQVEAEWLELAK